MFWEIQHSVDRALLGMSTMLYDSKSNVFKTTIYVCLRAAVSVAGWGNLGSLMSV